MASSSAGSHRRHRLAEDATVGQFIIGGEIGKGSFAQVFIGKHKVSGAAVAVKSVELARLSKKLKENLYGEIKILKTLRHPHIVALHDCVESATHINLVMEYCELGDLSMFIKKREKLITNPATHDLARKYPSTPNSGLNEVVTRHFLKQLASALKFLREGNFVHRDVKPQNLLLLPSPNYREAHKSARPILTASNDSLIPVAGLPSLPMLKLADFGFARVLPSTTLAETLCGSPLYMAPEILRYEKYDAKADLWSVGTVLYEMVSGRPPFRASNHVELLRKIEAAEDQIKFYRDCVVSAEMKSLIRALLKRNPVERLSFDNFFKHDVVTCPIPGLVEDDIPRPERPTLERVSERKSSKDLRIPGGSSSGVATANTATSTAGPRPGSSGSRPTDPGTPPSAPSSTMPRRQSTRRYVPHDGMAIAEMGDTERDTAARVVPASPRDKSGRGDTAGHQRLSYSPKQQDLVEGLGIRRGSVQPSSSAPTRPSAYEERRQHRLSSASLKQQAGNKVLTEEQERAAQDIAFERDYVVVEKKHVEVNAFADEMAANPRIAAQYQQGGGATISPSVSPRSAQAMIRRATQQGHPTSATGAVAPTPSRAMQIAQGTSTARTYHGSDRQGSLSASPKTKSFITKTIYDASFRLLGIKNPTALMGNGASPPQLYNPFPAYPTPNASPALLTDGKHGSADYNNGGASSGAGAASDSDARVAQLIEDYATRSDVVYWFAEVKYKQLVPLAPSAEHDLSGIPIADRLSSTEDDDELTVDAVVVVSEEALVLYIKALSLLAKSMDIASVWWASKMRGEPSSPGGSNASQLAAVRESPLGLRINAAVQWIRARFNEVLEKAAFSRERLVEAQKRLPEDHPSHPSNHNRDDTVGLTSSPSGSCGTAAGLAAAAGASTNGVFLTVGVSAEKLIYDRAVEMSRTAAIGEISNDDLAGCERSYVTAIRMLEAVLDTDDEPPRRNSSGAKDEKAQLREDEAAAGDINSEDQRTVEFMISMIKSRLSTVRRKAQLISSHSRVHNPQSMMRRRSGEVTPRGVSSHAS